MPLKELPHLSLQGSMLSQSKRSNKRKSRGCLIEGLDTECTPSDFIQQLSPSHKHQRRVSKGKENDGSQFVLARRSRRKKESTSGGRHVSELLLISCGVLFCNSCLSFITPSGISWDHLPDELLLRILFYLPLQDLLRMSIVCKRWHRLA